MASTKLTVARTTFDLPFEITVEILSRLPVKSLLRFKSVCKTWQFREIPNFEWQWLDEMDCACFVKIELLSYDPETWKTTDYILVGFHFNLLVTMWRPCFQSHKPTKVQTIEFVELTLV
ncbi:uncharacterized protein LOC131326013 isoform X2 [Rhododendron vialii]|uniref:uncharacterized protein LOC131326013 isoform X2 n=1 Tax=Rhododendron vialii TaxID=182163 RepID=UPI00265EB749|nr:uncharacterized protein LOC131326013 isoform X2 [Rhododendron vialii]